MDLAFYKLHSTGGDYILTSFIQETAPDLTLFPSLASMICKRRTGVGANGLLVLTRGIEHPMKLHFFPPGRNAAPGIPLDAIACAGRYAFNLGIANHNRISAESDFGPITVDAIDSVNFRIDAGSPADDGTGEIIDLSADADIIKSVQAGGRRMPFSPIKLQKRYAVIATESRPRSIRRIAAELAEGGELDGYETAFLRTVSQDECVGYCWSREWLPDHAEAMAACAAVGILAGFCDNEVTIRFRSYLLHAQWKDRRLYITVPTDYICSGSFSVEDEVLERARSTA